MGHGRRKGPLKSAPKQCTAADQLPSESAGPGDSADNAADKSLAGVKPPPDVVDGPTIDSQIKAAVDGQTTMSDTIANDDPVVD